MINKNNIKSILVGVLSLTSIIVIHEFGHFIFCKFFNVRTSVFSIGFGPKLISYQIWKTQFQIAAIPLGGYVSMNSQDIENLPVSKQLLIMFAGILFNIILSLVIIIYLYAKSRRKIKYHSQISKDSKEKSSELRKLLENKENIEDIGKNQTIGFLGIINLLGIAFRSNFDLFLKLLSIVSLNIAIFNLLPIPPLDGGQIFFVILKAFLGKNFNADKIDYIYYLIYIVSIALFIILNIWFLFRDTKRIRQNNIK